MDEPNRRAHSSAVAFALLGFVALAGTPVVWSASSPTEADLEIAMLAHDGFFVERCFELASGQLEFAVETPHAVDFNFHYHTATKTEIPIQTEIANRYTGELALASAGEYCFMWKNLGDRPAEYKIRLSYDVS